MWSVCGLLVSGKLSCWCCDLLNIKKNNVFVCFCNSSILCINTSYENAPITHIIITYNNN